MPPIIHEESCKRCGTCAAICPMNIFKTEKKAVPTVAYPEECWHCNACVLDCPGKAIELRLPLNFMVLNVSASNFHKGRCE